MEEKGREGRKEGRKEGKTRIKKTRGKETPGGGPLASKGEGG